MCNQFTFHHQFRIDTGRTKFEQETDSILSACGFHGKTIRILRQSTWEHRVLFSTCIQRGRKHQNTVYWVDINLALKKGLKFYQTRSNAIILHETLPAYCIPKAVRMETGEAIYEKVYASPWPLPKISLKHDWMKELVSEVAGQPEGEVARQAKSSQPTQPNPNPNHDRTVRPVVCSERAPCSQEIDTRFPRESKNSILEEDANHDRTVRPVVCSQRASHPRFSRDSKNVISEEEAHHDRTGRPVVCSQSERSMLNEVDIDFRLSGLPHSVVKQAENSRVRELVKQRENHPHREDLHTRSTTKQCLQPI